MAIINDPDQITAGSEVAFTVATQIITLTEVGNLSADGITGQALYSYSKEEWKDDSLTQGLIKYPFPMLAITPEQFEFGNNGTTFSDWKLNSEASRKLMRTCGFRENNNAGLVAREYLGAITLGNIDGTPTGGGDKAYFYVDGDATKKDTTFAEFTYAGPVNEAIQIFGDTAVDSTSPINADYRDTSTATGEDLILRLRIFGKTYDVSGARAIGFGASSLTYNAQRFPLAEAADPVITDLGVTTTNIDNDAPYTDMDIGWYAAAQSRSGFTVGTAEFGIIIDGDVSVPQQDGGGDASAEQIYAWTQRQLIKDKATDINTQTGSTATAYYGVFTDQPLILASTGNTLSSQQITNLDTSTLIGVYVDSFATDDKNRVQFRDNGTPAGTAPGNLVSFPFAATGSLVFNNNAQNDAAAKYWLYYRYTRDTPVSDLTITPTTGATATIGSAAGVDFTSTADFGAGALTNGDYIEITGASNAVNNTIWVITSVPTANSFTADVVNGSTPATETAFAGDIYRTPIGSPDATLVENFANVPIGDALVGGNATISFDYDYDQDTVGGRDTTANAQVVLKVIGTTTAQYAEANFSIAKTTGQQFPITAPLERNYTT